MQVPGKLQSEIFRGLATGKKYCGIKDGVGHGLIWTDESNNVIRWQHAGSSANEYTMKGLKFVLEVIFNDCEDFSEAEWSDYHIAYVPIEKGYKGFDYSSKHPNTFGV